MHALYMHVIFCITMQRCDCKSNIIEHLFTVIDSFICLIYLQSTYPPNFRGYLLNGTIEDRLYFESPSDLVEMSRNIFMMYYRFGSLLQ